MRLEVIRLDSTLEILTSNEVVRRSAGQFSASRFAFQVFAFQVEVNVAKMNFVLRRMSC